MTCEVCRRTHAIWNYTEIHWPGQTLPVVSGEGPGAEPEVVQAAATEAAETAVATPNGSPASVKSAAASVASLEATPESRDQLAKAAAAAIGSGPRCAATLHDTPAPVLGAPFPVPDYRRRITFPSSPANLGDFPCAAVWPPGSVHACTHVCMVASVQIWFSRQLVTEPQLPRPPLFFPSAAAHR